MYHQCKLSKAMMLRHAARRYSSSGSSSIINNQCDVPVITWRRLRSTAAFSSRPSTTTTTTKSQSEVTSNLRGPSLARNQQRLQHPKQKVCNIRDSSTLSATTTSLKAKATTSKATMNSTITTTAAAATTTRILSTQDEVLLSSGSVAAAAVLLSAAFAGSSLFATSGDNDDYCSCLSSATVMMPPAAAAAAAAAATTTTTSYTKTDSPSRSSSDSSSSAANSTTCEARRQGKSGGPRNVMIQRMRSHRGRGLHDKYNVDWEQILGEGAYGSVHPGRLAVTGEKVALKRISKKYTNSKEFYSETNALLRLYENGGHPNISGLRDMYEDRSNFYLILDLVSGGEMFEHLITYGAYSEADAARLMHEISSALAFVHGVGVVHADLKPENLLLCSKKRHDGTIKMIDFGCAQVLEEDDDCDVYSINDPDQVKKQTISQSDLYNINASTGDSLLDRPQSPFNDNDDYGEDPNDQNVGTTAYWPPERFEKGNYPDAAGDMWSVGVILYIMLTGVHPFDTMGVSTDDEIEKQIKNDPRPPMDRKFVGHLSESAIDLITKLMEPDPIKRLKAYEMLHHPWVRGETALTEKIEDSDKKLSQFKDVRNHIEAGVFSVLVQGSHEDMTLSEANPAAQDGAYTPTKENPNRIINRDANNLLKRAFEVFDAEGKGFITLDDLGRVVKSQTGSQLSLKDTDEFITKNVNAVRRKSRNNMLLERRQSGVNDYGVAGDGAGAGATDSLSLSDFAGLLSGLNHKHFPRGHYVFHAGEPGNAMYFLNSGKVEIQTRKGQLVAILRSGDFFGEGSLLDLENKRFTTAKCATPVDVIEIKRAEFEKYMTASAKTKQEIKRKWRARHLSYAKNLLRLQKNVKSKVYHKGDIVYKEGDIGTSMYRVDDNDGGELEVSHGSKVVHKYVAGDSFGESSLLFQRKRSSTVKCVSEKCTLLEMRGEDFHALINAFPEMAASLRNMCRKRLFKKAVKAYSLKQMNSRGDFSDQDLIDAFHHADKNNTGTLNLEEMAGIMHTMDPTYPMEEIKEFLIYVDIDEDGNVSLDEFKRIFRQFEHRKTPASGKQQQQQT